MKTKMSGKTFYRYPLPEKLIGFSSEEGKEIFKETLSEGMQSFFPLIEQFHTQNEPTCKKIELKYRLWISFSCNDS